MATNNNAPEPMPPHILKEYKKYLKNLLRKNRVRSKVVAPDRRQV